MGEGGGGRGEKDTKKLFHNYDGLLSVTSFILSPLTTTSPPPVLIHSIDFCVISTLFLIFPVVSSPFLVLIEGFNPVVDFHPCS